MLPPDGLARARLQYETADRDHRHTGIDQSNRRISARSFARKTRINDRPSTRQDALEAKK